MLSITKKCPYCGEEILAIAIKCKHCGSMLTDSDNIYSYADPTTSVKLALANKYELINKIGEGGMATVYKARQINLDRIVALKVIHQNLIHDKEFLERFHREARIAASLNHPNIVTIYDEGIEKGVHFIAMEYLDGVNLHYLINNKGRLSEKDTINIVCEIGSALSYAHKKGIIHRDIKCANIILTNEGRVVLTDFGIARAVSGTKSSLSGAVIGTPEYMSPEQIDGKMIDHRTDLYSLGVVMYECLTGRVPFKEANPITTVYKIVNVEIPPIETLRTDISYWLASVINKCLVKNAEYRFNSGEDIKSALQNKKHQELNRPANLNKEKFSKNYSPSGTIRVNNSDITKKSSSSVMSVLGGLIFVLLIIIIVMILSNKSTTSKSSALDNEKGSIEDISHNEVSNSEYGELNSLLIEARNVSNNLSSLNQANRLLNLSSEILSLSPNNPNASNYTNQVKDWIDRSINIAVGNNNWNNAIDLIDFAINKFGGNEYQKKKRDIELSQRQTERDQRINSLLQQADNYIKNYRWDEAISTFDQVLGISSGNATARNGKTRVIEAIVSRGNQLYNNGSYSQAYQQFQKALSLRPGDTRIQIKLTKAEEKAR